MSNATQTATLRSTVTSALQRTPVGYEDIVLVSPRRAQDVGMAEAHKGGFVDVVRVLREAPGVYRPHYVATNHTGLLGGCPLDAQAVCAWIRAELKGYAKRGLHCSEDVAEYQMQFVRDLASRLEDIERY